MPAQRVPGALGQWTDSFPETESVWSAAPAWAASPSGPAANGLHGVGAVGLERPLVSAAFAAEGVEAPQAPAERYRYMKIQGQMIKVRCISLRLLRQQREGQAAA